MVEEALLDPANGCYGVNIPAGQGYSANQTVKTHVAKNGSKIMQK